MNFGLISFFILLTLILGVDWYILHVINSRSGNKIVRAIHIVVCLGAIGLLFPMLFIPIHTADDPWFNVQMWMFVWFIAILSGQGTFAVFDLIASIPCLFKRQRVKVISVLGLILGIASTLLILWGALINRFNLVTIPVTVEVKELPEAFDGYRIVQLSDMHVGTFNTDTTFVARIVDEVNALEPDLILFTGDIVNRRACEAAPFAGPLSRLRARDGQYAVLGNHDYADYFYGYEPSLEKEADLQSLKDFYATASLKLMVDSTVIIHRGNDSIALIGVGNIGHGRFPVYGSLEKAYPAPGDSVTKVLMSHDPDHWRYHIADNPDVNIALTLSGHTHAAQIQFGRVSPSAFIYKNWWGLYADADSTNQLYVNRGCGTVGTPMRIGANPEITLITLRRK